MKTRTRRPKPFFTAIRIFICIVAAGLTVLTYIERQNDLTGLRLAIPALAKEVKNTQEDNIRLAYEIERFESPQHLMELARKPEFSHMKHPYINEEVILAKMPPLPKAKSSEE